MAKSQPTDIRVQKPEEVTIKLADIAVDPDIQIRVLKLDISHVDDLLEDLRGGSELTLKCVFDGETYHLYDGFHSIVALSRYGAVNVSVLSVLGTKDDAFDLACSTNLHGKRRTRADVANAIVRQFSRYPDRDNAQIGRACFVHPSTVASHRKKYLANGRTWVVPPEDTPTIPADITKPKEDNTSEPPTQGESQNGSTDLVDKDQPDPQENKPEASSEKPEKKKPKKDKAKSKVSDVMDGLGNAVPHHLRDIFADTRMKMAVDQLRQIAAQVDALGVEELCRDVTSRLRDMPFIHGSAAVTALDSIVQLGVQAQVAAEAIEHGIPYAVCARCFGDGKTGRRTCQDCIAGCGHLPKWKHEDLHGK